MAARKQFSLEGRVRPYGFEWAPDNSGFYAWAPYSTDCEISYRDITLLYFYDMNSGKSGQVPLDWETESGRISLRRATIYFGIAGGAHFEMARYSRDKSGDGWSGSGTVLKASTRKTLRRLKFPRMEDDILFAFNGQQASANVSRAD